MQTYEAAAIMADREIGVIIHYGASLLGMKNLEGMTQKKQQIPVGLRRNILSFMQNGSRKSRKGMVQ